MLSALKKQRGINLLPQEEFSRSVAGRILSWVLNTFRVIIIVTEMIIMGAFLSRFWLDAKVADLNDEIEEKKTILLSSSEFINEYQNIQTKLDAVSKIGKLTSSDKLSQVSKFIPEGVTLTEYSYTDKEISLVGQSQEEKEIARFISNLSSNPEFQEVNLTQLGSKEAADLIINFTITIKI